MGRLAGSLHGARSSTAHPGASSDLVTLKEIAALLRSFLERLGLPGDAARLHLHPPGAVAAGWSEPGVVHLRPPVSANGFWDADGLGLRILAHEAAHIGQFATLGRPFAVALLEREADDVAAELLAPGGRPQVQLAAAPGCLHWSRAGHYYTTYLTALVWGAPEYYAQRMAFLSQVPDLVSELDAITQAAISETLIGKDVPAVAAGAYLTTKADTGVRPQDYEVCRDVVEGLHCLTGAPVAQERRRRIDFTMAAGDPLEFGISLHALGDAWAHCNGAVMYGNGYGHLFGGHDPDLISERTGPYLDYVRTLYRVMSAKAPYVDCRPKVECPNIADILDKLSLMAFVHPDGDEETGQIRYMRSLIDSMSVDKGLLNYQPANDCVGWQRFITSPAGHNGILKSGDLDVIRGYGRRWRLTPVDGRTPAARIADAQRRAQGRPERVTRDAGIGVAVGEAIGGALLP